MDISFSIPLDSDGFVRRECPTCEREFKWHHGPANEQGEAQAGPPPAYYCPLCGQPSGPDTWWTTAQLEHGRGTAMPVVMRTLQDEIAGAFRGNKFFYGETRTFRRDPGRSHVTDRAGRHAYRGFTMPWVRASQDPRRHSRTVLLPALRGTLRGLRTCAGGKPGLSIH